MVKNDALVVLVHGIYGGHLKGARGKRWLGLSQVLGLDRRKLALPLTWVDGRWCDRDGPPVDAPIGMQVAACRSIGPCAALAAAALQHGAGVRVRPATRARRVLGQADRHARGGRLHARAAGACRRAQHGRAGDLAGHPAPSRSSARASYSAACPSAQRRRVHARHSPWLRTRGSTSGFSPEVVATWSAHWVFFPQDGRGLMDGERRLDHDWYDVAAHEEHRLGVFARGLTGEREPYRQHLRQALARAVQTRTLLEDPGALGEAAVRMAVIRSSAQQTPLTVHRGGPARARLGRGQRGLRCRRWARRRREHGASGGAL